MSRSGYSDDCDGWAMIRWRGAVNSAIKGKRGQQTLREILAALDAMPDKSLVAESLVTGDGEFCTLGVLGAQRGIDLESLDPEDPEGVAAVFGIAPALVKEIVYLNDESIGEYDYVQMEVCGPMRRGHPDWGDHRKTVRVQRKDVGQRRWHHMRKWVADQLVTEAA